MPKFKMGKEKDLTDPGSLGKGGGRMYTGGTPNFDESTGKYREPKPGRGIGGVPGLKQPFPGPGMGIGKPTPIDMVGRRKRPTRLGQKPGLRTIQPVNPRRGMGY
jgi:hypothetical protein